MTLICGGWISPWECDPATAQNKVVLIEHRGLAGGDGALRDVRFHPG